MAHGRFHLAMALALSLSGGRASAEPSALAAPTPTPLALRLPHSWPTPARAAPLRPFLTLGPIDVPAPPFERAPLSLTPTLQLSLETLRLFAGQTPRRVSPFIGWSTQSLGLRIRF